MNRHVKKIISIFKYNRKKTNKILSKIQDNKNSKYILFYNPECIGVTNSVKELFDCEKLVELYEIFNKNEIQDISNAIKRNGITQVIFATMAFGYKALAQAINDLDDDIEIDFLWHGSHALFVNKDEEFFLDNILDLERRGVVSKIGFLKESMYEFYKSKGYNAYFIKNTVNNIKKEEYIKQVLNNGSIKIGLYSSGDGWEKNTYNQLSACAMVKNGLIDIVPSTKLSKSFCKLMNIKEATDTLSNSISREELLKRMAKNDINLYVTFSECAPMIPLESFEVGVPCIIGDNTHYFKNSKLEEFLVVKSEDNIDEIYEKINLAIKNKDDIMKLYSTGKKQYDVESKKSVNDFLIA